MELLFNSIAGLVLSGVTIVAYNRPKQYGRLCLVLECMTIILYLIVFSWNFSNMAAFSAARSYIPYEKLAEAENAVNAKQFLSGPLCPFLGFLWFSYLIFLNYLPDILGHDKLRETRDEV
jgi:hypothetical protein